VTGVITVCVELAIATLLFLQQQKLRFLIRTDVMFVRHFTSFHCYQALSKQQLYKVTTVTA
jgi:hypothetical protein